MATTSISTGTPNRRPVTLQEFVWDPPTLQQQDDSSLQAPQESPAKVPPSIDNNDNNDNSRTTPKILWLASYPNSGTSYTMTMVERSTNWSTATNYGLEISFNRDDSIPIDEHNYPDGPFWEGLSGKRGSTIRELPPTYVLTKTHCGGRCVNCPATDYVVNNVTAFLQACQKTSFYRHGEHRFGKVDAGRIARLIHLVRNPFDNVVARYHLERRHLIKKGYPNAQTKLPYNATGFAYWCGLLDNKYGGKPEDAVLPTDIVHKMRRVPCRAEFYKYLQWHNRLIELYSSEQLLFKNDGGDRVLVVHYENYESKLNQTVADIMDFVEQKVKSPVRPFRALPSYEDHFSDDDRLAAKELAEAVASPDTWALIRHYFEDNGADTTG